VNGIARLTAIGLVSCAAGGGIIAAIAANAQPGQPAIESVSDDTGLTWAVRSGDTVRTTSTQVTLVVASIEHQKTLVHLDGEEVAADAIEDTGSGVAVTLTASDKEHLVRVFQEKVENEVGRVTIQGPHSADSWKPSVTKIFNNAYAHADQGIAPGNSAVRVFGRYLRVEGAGDTDDTKLDFALFGTNNQLMSEQPVTVRSKTADGWTADIRLPDLSEGTSGKLFALATNRRDGSHAYADEGISFEVISRNVSPQLPQITSVYKTNPNDVRHLTARQAWLLNSTTVHIKGTVAIPQSLHSDSRIVLFRTTARGDSWEIQDSAAEVTPNGWDADVTLPRAGDYLIQAKLVQGNMLGKPSAPTKLEIRTEGPRVVGFDPANLAFAPGADRITIQFNTENPLDPASARNEANYEYQKASDDSTKQSVGAGNVVFNQHNNSVTLLFPDLEPELYEVTIKGADADGTPHLTDIYGNHLNSSTPEGQAAEEKFNLYKPVGGDLPSVSRGLAGITGPYVEYPEVNWPRPPLDGFNPSDRVETRVARLYYFRDAHRVAQIINREARSYNRHAVDMRRQMADKARAAADTATGERRLSEQQAVRAAAETRQAEQALQQTKRTLAETQRDIQEHRTEITAREEYLRTHPNAANRAAVEDEIRTLRSSQATIESALGAIVANIRAASDKVQHLREEEAQASDALLRAQEKEDRSREEQFRREVAAAHEDPDTYAPGRPRSIDPVRQVSVSVIGEGLIQLRGPIKGVNVIRKMINQIDSPVGQVRVNVHTVQVNGEHGDRMEQVADRIQKYIDHSRFLTAQSAEMLRRAVIIVAGQRAMADEPQYASGSQQVRDQRYLYNFFGRDFIDELAAMDSEFLQTGNKLLSLHSMDTTSLSSALFLLALAKNDTRQDILRTFEEMVSCELPQAENRYYEAGTYLSTKCTTDKLFHKKEKLQLFSHNAKFVSLRGFFNNEVYGHSDTMTPIQREFIRLAQIFKARLITEMEYKQRVMERGVIEERLGSRLQELADARVKETAAQRAFEEVEKARQTQQLSTLLAIQKIRARVEEVREKTRKAQEHATAGREDIASAFTRLIQEQTESFRRYDAELAARAEKEFAAMLTDDGEFKETADRSIPKRIGEWMWSWQVKYIEKLKKKLPTARAKPIAGEILIWGKRYPFTLDASGWQMTDDDLARMRRDLSSALDHQSNSRKMLDEFVLNEGNRRELATVDSLQEGLRKCAQAKDSDANTLMNAIIQLPNVSGPLALIYADIDYEATDILAQLDRLAENLAGSRPQVKEGYTKWLVLQSALINKLSEEGQYGEDAKKLFLAANNAFQELLREDAKLQFKERAAQNSRRPLDHKKFLDMLIDDLEEKEIELLEGTRAHTANIDNYIKRIATALENDFNTQFYFPSFRAVREASRYWDVNLGQIETTGILANNRAFAKVEPGATMEFDLPKRDILIAEAMNGAKAMMQDFGALASDPTFLAMAAMGSGQSTASQMGGAGGGLGRMRNVLPGMDSQMGEEILSQSGPGQAKLGSALESLIPDPAIYKFETGTGFEIRPVIQPDGQAVVFHFNYMYTTNVREPVRADEKHLGRVKRHFIDTDVQLSNYELREVSRYMVALKASRTSRGVPLLEDVPLAGALFRPLPQQESSLQENLIMAQATIYPTLFDLMGLRWAPAVADLDPLRLSNQEFIVRNRHRHLQNRVYDYASGKVDEYLRIPETARRPDLYRTQETIPEMHPNGYQGPGLDLRDSDLEEDYDPSRAYPRQRFIPGESAEGAPFRPGRRGFGTPEGMYIDRYPVDVIAPKDEAPPTPVPE